MVPYHTGRHMLFPRPVAHSAVGDAECFVDGPWLLHVAVFFSNFAMNRLLLPRDQTKHSKGAICYMRSGLSTAHITWMQFLPSDSNIVAVTSNSVFEIQDRRHIIRFDPIYSLDSKGNGCFGARHAFTMSSCPRDTGTKSTSWLP